MLVARGRTLGEYFSQGFVKSLVACTSVEPLKCHDIMGAFANASHLTMWCEFFICLYAESRRLSPYSSH